MLNSDLNGLRRSSLFKDPGNVLTHIFQFSHLTHTNLVRQNEMLFLPASPLPWLLAQVDKKPRTRARLRPLKPRQCTLRGVFCCVMGNKNNTKL